MTCSACITRQVQVSMPEVMCGCIAALCQWVYLKHMGTVTATHETSERGTTLTAHSQLCGERLLCVL